MAGQTETRIVKIDGSKKTWPDRLDGVEVPFQTIPDGASKEDAIAVLEDMTDKGTHLVAFLRDALSKTQDASLRSFLNGKAREEGKTYTRDEIKRLGTRSETISKAAVSAFGDGWTIPAPRISTASKLSAAEARARRSEEQQAASATALIETLRDLAKSNKKAANERLAAMIGAGLIPADTTL